MTRSTLDLGTLALMIHTTDSKLWIYSTWTKLTSMRPWWRTLSSTVTTFLYLSMLLCTPIWPWLIVKTAKIYSLLSLSYRLTLATQRNTILHSRCSSQMWLWMSGSKLCSIMKSWSLGPMYLRPPSKPFFPIGRRSMASERCGHRLMLAVEKTRSVRYLRLPLTSKTVWRP